MDICGTIRNPNFNLTQEAKEAILKADLLNQSYHSNNTTVN